MDLFSLKMEGDLNKMAPLAQRMRPRNIEEFVGQDHIMGEGMFIERIIASDFLPSLLFYGPPGIGKTSLAEIIAKESHRDFYSLSAVTSNVKELRGILDKAEEKIKMQGIQSVLFLDEIHRFTKSQQDVLLPYVERGKILLMGATTENPFFYVNKALLSRLHLIELKALSSEDLDTMISLALEDKERGYGNRDIEIDKLVREKIIALTNGDGRSLYNTLENLVASGQPDPEGKIKIGPEDLKASFVTNKFSYDREGNAHYDTISAFIKSIRGSDPDAALFYLAKMLESGEKPEFIGRRLIISASEDISNADPYALSLAVSAFEAVRIIGMPEARIILSQITTYLASAPKSNASYLAINDAIADVKSGLGKEIPNYLRDGHQPLDKEDRSYKYPHNFENAYVDQRYFPKDMEEKTYYSPVPRGYEKTIETYLKNRKK